MPSSTARHGVDTELLLAPVSGEATHPTKATFMRALTWIVFFMFGTVSWTLVTALFAEAAYFQKVLPEGQAIFADLDAAMEFGNVVPAIIFVFCSSEASLRKNNHRITYGVAACAIFTAVLWSTTWDITVNSTTSAFSLLAAWLSGAVGSTSMVVFFNFAAQYGPDAIGATSVGIGACGLVTNVLGIIQGLPNLKDSHQNKSSHANRISTSVSPLEVESGAADDGSLLFGPSIFFVLVGVWLILSSSSIVVARIGCCGLRGNFDGGNRGVSREDRSSMDEKEACRNIAPKHASLNSQRSYQPTYDTLAANEADDFANDRMGFVGSAVRALKANPGPMAAIFWSCLTQFAMPGLVPYLVPCGSDHASNSFWVTLFYLTGSLLGRIVTVAFHYRRFGLLNALQTGGLVYAIIVTRMAEPLPVFLSILVVTVFSSVHGYIVTEVFHIVGKSAQQSAVGGLMNQAGALTGSLFTFLLVKMAVIVKRTC